MEKYDKETDELFENQNTMVNMTLNDEEEVNYIIDIRRDDENIFILYADGHEEKVGISSLHNFNVYRYKLHKQFYDYYDKFLDQAGFESLKLYFKKYVELAISAIGLYFMYECDIHIIMKILISLGVFAFDIIYYFNVEYDLLLLNRELNRAEAINVYLDNVKDFVIYNDDEKGEDFSLGIEEVWQNELNKHEVSELAEYARNNAGMVLKYDISKYKESN